MDAFDALRYIKENTLPSSPDVYWEHVNKMAQKERALYEIEDARLNDFSRVDDQFTI